MDGRDITGFAAKASVLLSQGGYVGEVVDAIGGTLCTPHMGGDRIYAYFGHRRRVEGAEVLEMIALEVVPVEIKTGDDLECELAYENYKSAAKYGREVLTKAAADVALGGAIMFSVT